MELLGLPLELVQLVLHHCTTAAFLHAALSCRSLFNVASGSRELVVHHLSQTPGLPLDSSSSSSATPPSSAPELFRLLRQRAAAQLYGLDHRADAATHTLSDTRSIDPRASAICASGGHGNLAVVERGTGAVFLFNTRPGHVMEPVCELRPPFPYAGRFHARKAFFSNDGRTLSVLQKYGPKDSAEDDYDVPPLISEPMSPFVRQAMQPFLKPENLHLAHYFRSSPDEAFSHVALASLDGPHDHEPTFVAAANPWFVAVCWHHVDPQYSQLVQVHYVEAPEAIDMHSRDNPDLSHIPNLITISYRDGIVIDKTGPHSNLERERIVRLRFNDRNSQLLYYYPPSPLYGEFQRVKTEYEIGTGSSRSNDADVHCPDGNRSLPVDTPIFCTHETLHQVTPTGNSLCEWSYLALTVELPALPSDSPFGGLVTSSARCRSSHCGHIPNLDRGRRLNDWTLVARLLDFDTAGTITSFPSDTSYNTTYSLPPQTAASPRATRLAVASWKVIRVWPLEPTTLIRRNSSRFYPGNYYRDHIEDPEDHHDGSHNDDEDEDEDEGEDEDDDDASEIVCHNVVSISPIVLHSDAVVFSIAFALDSENELVCLTDRGVVTWDLGPFARGQRGATNELSDPEPLDLEPDGFWDGSESEISEMS